ncbi:MAG TPA: TA system VapC family ribonuclease toxin [Terriglobales bacterium]|nr:TA system VapC family ribonuclease toxin [Terriglobales bacterium]
MKSYFPDVNVWIALAYEGHQHHASASSWFARINGGLVYFCRFTQLGLLRLLTHPTVMQEDVRTQAKAWQIYDSFLQDERVSFHPESDVEQIESAFRKLTSGGRSFSQQWPDAYLAAFAGVAGLTLVTFDRGLRQMAAGSTVLLR